MPDKEIVKVPGLKSIGPYSHAVRSGGLLFVSGQPGIHPQLARSQEQTLSHKRDRRSRTWTWFCALVEANSSSL
jgi:enamine deaminase RidA (YjgF/YER057c/UK114 family)